MKANYSSRYGITILILLLNISPLLPHELPTRSMSALMQSAFNSSRAAVQSSSLTSVFFALGGSYLIAETISYKYRKKTLLVGALKTYVHNATYWTLKRLLCLSHCEPEIITEPYLYK